MTKALLDEPTEEMRRTWDDLRSREDDAKGEEVAVITESEFYTAMRSSAPQEPVAGGIFGGTVAENAAALLEWDRKGGWATNADVRAAIRSVANAALRAKVREPVVDDDAEWLLPYRSMDEAGSPEAAACVGRKWIEDIAEAVRRKPGGPAMLQISSYGAGVTTLYQRNELLAVTTAFRDEMNFTVLVRWLCDRLQAKAPETPYCGIVVMPGDEGEE